MFDHYRQINEIRLDPAYVATRFAGRSGWGAAAQRLAAFARKFLVSIAQAGDLRAWLREAPAGPILLFSSTGNQTHALTPLAAELGPCVWVTYNQRGTAAAPHLRTPDLLVHLLAVLTVPLTLAFIAAFCLVPGLGARRSERWRAVAFSLDEVARTLGYVLVARWMLARLRCDRVVMANDHNSINRALCLAARAQGVRSFYVQHAPVSSLFPRLLFDTAFVDGEHAAAIYREKPSATEIVVTGAGRYGPLVPRAPLAELGRPPVVALALNKLDDSAIFLAYLERVRGLGLPVVVRPHPGMSAADLGFLPRDVAVDRAPTADHLAAIDILIAGSSGILLDAFMAGVVPVAATDLSRAGDYYGFVRHRAVFACTLATVGDMLADLDALTIAELRPGIAFYNAAVQSEHRSTPSARQARLVLAATLNSQGDA